MSGFRIERLTSRINDCCHCPAKGVPCLVLSIYVRELGDRVTEVRVSGPVALCHKCADRKADGGTATTIGGAP